MLQKRVLRCGKYSKCGGLPPHKTNRPSAGLLIKRNRGDYFFLEAVVFLEPAFFFAVTAGFFFSLTV